MKPSLKAKLIVWLNVLTLIGGAFTVFLLLKIITNAATQSAKTQDKIVVSQKLTETELRCLAAFFSKSDRQNLKISNLDKCTILHTDNGQSEVLPLTPTTNSTQSSPAASDITKQNSTANQTSIQPNTIQNQPSTTTQTPADSQSTSQAAGSAHVSPDDTSGSASVQLQPATTIEQLLHPLNPHFNSPLSLYCLNIGCGSRWQI